jgi:hypothetical protein
VALTTGLLVEFQSILNLAALVGLFSVHINK